MEYHAPLPSTPCIKLRKTAPARPDQWNWDQRLVQVHPPKELVVAVVQPRWILRWWARMVQPLKKPSFDGHHWWINIHMAILYIYMDIHNISQYLNILQWWLMVIISATVVLTSCRHMSRAAHFCAGVWHLIVGAQRQQSIPQTHSTIQRLKFYLCVCKYTIILYIRCHIHLYWIILQ